MINRWGKIFLFVLLFCGISQSASAQQVGLNFNEQVNFVDIKDVDRTETRWVRGFIEFFQFYDGERDLETDTKVTKFLEMKDAGYKTILSIKWRFANKSFPDPDSQEMKDYVIFLGKMLDRFWNKLDIIVVGNEPFIESRSSERDDKLVEFYKEVTKRVIEYRSLNSYVPVYIGSFDNIYIDAKRRPGFVSLMEYAKNNEDVAGVSIHIHHANYSQMDFSLQYTSDHIADNQKILITEYSLMKHWRNHTNDPIPAAFASDYGYDPAWQVYQYINHALKNPVPRAEWVDFLSKSSWFENRKDYLWQSYEMFKSYNKFHIGTYAFRQSFPFNKDFTVNTSPWVLNGIYANRSVESDPETGENQFNYNFINDFLKIQQDYRENIVSSVVEESNNSIIVYPNPVKDILQIKEKKKIGSFFIYDQMGRIIMAGKGDNNIDVSKLGNGFYILSVPENDIYTKFLKQ